VSGPFYTRVCMQLMKECGARRMRTCRKTESIGATQVPPAVRPSLRAAWALAAVVAAADAYTSAPLSSDGTVGN
jgi:hypothetical protein